MILLPSARYFADSVCRSLNARLYWEWRMQWGQDPPLYLRGITRKYAWEVPQTAKLRDRVQLVRAPMTWADWVCIKHHYMKRRMSDLAEPMAYAVCLDGDVVGVIVMAWPHFPKKKGVFGMPGCPSRWQTLMLSRLWLHPSVQGLQVVDRRGRSHSFPVATCALGHLMRVVQFDWLQHRPPKDETLPYHILQLLAYSDKRVGHEGTVYRAAGFELIGTSTSEKRGRHGKSEGPDLPYLKENLMIYRKLLLEPDWQHNAQLQMLK